MLVTTAKPSATIKKTETIECNFHLSAYIYIHIYIFSF